jgi:hypothetical protein
MPNTTSVAQISSFQDDTSNNYIHIVEQEEHGGTITMELLESCSKNFTVPVLFRQMVPLAEEVGTRSFFDIEPGQKLIWHERRSKHKVGFRDREGRTDYNFLKGEEGTSKEFIDAIFVHKKDVYANLGYISSGFEELEKHPWGATFFKHVYDEVFRNDWFDIPEWELSGHVFLGNNTEMFPEPGEGSPGTNWHMFPTVNIFVMLVGGKKWLIRPPLEGDHLKDREELIYPSGGRETPVDQNRKYDTVYVTPGDALFNVPYEWHKVMNAKGPSLGAAFRVVDRPYIEELLNSPAVKSNLKLRKYGPDEAHTLTSLKMASRDPVRMQMALNTMEMMLSAAARYPFLAAKTND